MIGFRPSQLPAALLDLAAYKLALAASLGLLGAGALFLRHARRAQAQHSASSLGLNPSPSYADGLHRTRPAKILCLPHTPHLSGRHQTDVPKRRN
jgi:hypothetical protein